MSRAVAGRSEREDRMVALFQSLGQAVWHAQRLEETMASTSSCAFANRGASGWSMGWQSTMRSVGRPWALSYPN